jgi:hypothetical protein
MLASTRQNTLKMSAYVLVLAVFLIKVLEILGELSRYFEWS